MVVSLMTGVRARAVALTRVALVALSACAAGAESRAALVEVRRPGPTSSTIPPTVEITTTVAPPTTTAVPVAPVEAVPPTPGSRQVTEQAYTPFAQVGGVTLLHPATRVERVGFHEANHDGA